MQDQVIISEDHGTHGGTCEYSRAEAEERVLDLMKQNPTKISFEFEQKNVQTSREAVTACGRD